MLRTGKPVIPKEHGAWMVLLVALAVGSFAVRPAAGYHWGGFALITVSTLFGFLAFTPLRLLWRTPSGVDRGRMAAWLSIYAAVTAGSFLALVIWLERYGLIWFVIPAAFLMGGYLWSASARKQRTLPVEVLGIAGLAICGPVASYVQLNAVTTEALLLYLLLALWFTDRMMTARKTLELIRGGVRPGTVMERLRRRAPQLAVHAATLIIALVIITLSGGRAPYTAFAPFLLATGRNAAEVGLGASTDDPMKVGFGEMRLGIAFAALMVLAWRV